MTANDKSTTNSGVHEIIEWTIMWVIGSVKQRSNVRIMMISVVRSHISPLSLHPSGLTNMANEENYLGTSSNPNFMIDYHYHAGHSSRREIIHLTNLINKIAIETNLIFWHRVRPMECS